MLDMPAAKDSAERTRPPRSNETLRRCIVSGDTMARERLIRFVVGPDDIVVPDLSERLPGRGLWVTGRHEVVAQACAKGSFRRAARRAVTPLVGPGGEDLADWVDARLAQRCLEALGLARRAGKLILGFDQVRGALKEMVAAAGARPGSAVLLSASDAAADGRGKLAALAARATEGGAAVTYCDLFDAKTLGSAVGRDQVVHALLQTDAAGERLYAALRRLAYYRGVTPRDENVDAALAPADVVDME